MKRIEAKPKGVPNFIWEMYEESWTDYNSEVGRQQLATTRMYQPLVWYRRNYVQW